MTTPPALFEIRTKQGTLATNAIFTAYEQALDYLTEDPLMSANANHPFFWGNHFEIVEVTA